MVQLVRVLAANPGTMGLSLRTQIGKVRTSSYKLFLDSHMCTMTPWETHSHTNQKILLSSANIFIDNGHMVNIRYWLKIIGLGIYESQARTRSIAYWVLGIGEPKIKFHCCLLQHSSTEFISGLMSQFLQWMPNAWWVMGSDQTKSTVFSSIIYKCMYSITTILWNRKF